MSKKTDEIAGLAIDGAEFVIDQVVENKLLKDIPLVNSVVNLLKLATKTIPDYLFAKKLKVFLECLESVSDEDKEKMKSFAKHDKNSERLSENILNIINRASDGNKAKIIALFFIAYVGGHIDNRRFRMIIEIVDSTFIDDLELFFNDDTRPNLSIAMEYKTFKQRGFAWMIKTRLVEEIEKFSDIEIRRADGKKENVSIRERSKYRLSDDGESLLKAYQYASSRIV